MSSATVYTVGTAFVVAAAALGCNGGDVTVPPTTGTLEITTSTSGTEQDADGYAVQIDAGSTAAIGTAATISVADMSPGNHAVQLGEVAANCTVSGDNPRMVSVTAGEKATVAFAVTCSATSPTTGIIRVSVTTSGSPIDPDGYVAKLDGGDPGLSVGTNGSVSFTSVSVGSHAVALNGLAANCSVTGETSRSITVAAGAIAELSFAVTCAGTTGSIKVTTATTGSSQDPDGYTVSVDAGAPQAVGINANLTIPDLAAGDHSVTLAGVASNCTAANANPRTVTVTAGNQAPADFTVSCAWLPLQWQNMNSEASIDFPLYDVWGSSATDVLAVGTPDGEVAERSAALHYDGQTWSRQITEEPATLRAVWGSARNDVFWVGWYFRPNGHFNPLLFHFNGNTWSPMTPPEPSVPGVSLVVGTVWGTSGTDVFAVGNEDNSGTATPHIAHYNGTNWSRMTLPVAPDRAFFGVFGTSSSDVYAVGCRCPSGNVPSSGSIFHYDGSLWREVFTDSEPGGFNDVWSSSPTDVFVVGYHRILHYDGHAWSSTPMTDNINGVWGASSTDVYAVGNESILHYDGQSWTQVFNRGGQKVWGSSSSDVFVVGFGGTLLHGTR